MWLGLLLLRYTLFTLKSSNRIILEYLSWFREAFLQFHYLFKIGKEKGGQESYYFILLCFASKGALILSFAYKTMRTTLTSHDLGKPPYSFIISL